MLQILDQLKKEKVIILFSSIIILLSVFFWDLKIGIFQAKYLISFLLVFNFILFKKVDLKYYLYILGLCLILLVHLLFSNLNSNLLFDKYIIFSFIFLYINLAALYKIQPFFDKILNKTITLFIFSLNIVFFLELIFFDFYLYDHENLINGLCVMCHKDHFPIFNLIFTENSHLGMISAAVILYSFIQFKKKNNLEKLNIFFFTIANFIFFLSLTLMLGIMLSSLALLIFGLLKNFKDKIYILFPIILSLCIFLSITNCWSRVYQVLNLEILYEREAKDNYASEIGNQIGKFKKSARNVKKISNFSELNKDTDIELSVQKTIQKILNFNIFSNVDKEKQTKDIKSLVKEKVISDKEKVISDKEKVISDKEKQSKDIKSLDVEKIMELANIDREIAIKVKKEIDQLNIENIDIIKSKVDKKIVIIEKKQKRNITVNETINATTIVHLNHYMVAFGALKNNPLGYGFQNYKQASFEFAKNNKMIGGYTDQILYNFNDGSNNFNKLLVEFGYFNILLIILFIRFYLKTDLSNSSKIFIFTIIITQLFRAAGYFNGGFLFVVIAGTLSLFIKQKK